jgi:hypothetical protein
LTKKYIDKEHDTKKEKELSYIEHYNKTHLERFKKQATYDKKRFL